MGNHDENEDELDNKSRGYSESVIKGMRNYLNHSMSHINTFPPDDFVAARDKDRRIATPPKIQPMNPTMTQALIPRKELKWINKKNERLCYFVWCYLRISVVQDSDGADDLKCYLVPNARAALDEYIYATLQINQNPINIGERHQAIIDFFDKVGVSLVYLIALNEDLKASWRDIYNFTEKFKWLDKKNQSQCDWAWGYLDKAAIPHYFLSPAHPSDKHGMVIASFDIWTIDPGAKEAFIKKMKKAWEQKNYRDKRKRKKAHNISMGKGIKFKLDHIAKRQGKTINKTLEWLINKEYENTSL